jgi:5-methylcytosine-specific restriction endonuclease McrA
MYIIAPRGGLFMIPIGSSCNLYRNCNICGELKHSKRSFTKRVGRCDDCVSKIRLGDILVDVAPNIGARCVLFKECKICRELQPRSFLNRSICEICANKENINIYQKVKERDNYICHYCGNYGDTVDHIIPTTKGGVDSEENLVCSCQTCNKEKGNMDYNEFIKEPVLNRKIRELQNKWSRH